MKLEFLDDDELYRITRRKRYKAQMKILRALRYVARPDGNGRPLVLRSHVEAKFGIDSPSEKKTGPNWESMDATKASH